ncbi:hypothetical protein SH668x_001273 [Planctomicrobium sp. SH668]|uniref:hypothetical protein n=1 Tax=Planctomicrobium sp. SH668 TaxID=3448126 RepID=UPI003F5B66FE
MRATLTAILITSVLGCSESPQVDSNPVVHAAQPAAKEVEETSRSNFNAQVLEGLLEKVSEAQKAVEALKQQLAESDTALKIVSHTYMLADKNLKDSRKLHADAISDRQALTESFAKMRPADRNGILLLLSMYLRDKKVSSDGVALLSKWDLPTFLSSWKDFRDDPSQIPEKFENVEQFIKASGLDKADHVIGTEVERNKVTYAKAGVAFESESKTNASLKSQLEAAEKALIKAEVSLEVYNASNPE